MVMVRAMDVEQQVNVPSMEKHKVQLIFINTYGNWELVGTDRWPGGFLTCTGKCLAEAWVF